MNGVVISRWNLGKCRLLECSSLDRLRMDVHMCGRFLMSRQVATTTQIQGFGFDGLEQQFESVYGLRDCSESRV